MLRNLGIRWQILSALALPVLVLGLISSQVTYQALLDMREASQARDLAQGAGGFADLVAGLQAERALSVSVVLGNPGADKQLKTVRAAVDQGLDQVRAQVYGNSPNDAVKQVLARSATGHSALAELRAAVDAGSVETRAVVSRYSTVIATDVEVPSDLAATLSNQDAASNFQQFAQLSRAGEALAQEQLIGATAIMNGKADTVDQRELGAQEAAGRLALDGFRRSAEPDQLAALRDALAAPAARSGNLATARADFQFAGTLNKPTVKLADWTAITTAQLAAMRKALDSVNQDGITLAGDAYDSARTRLQLTLVGAIGITLLTLLLALGLSRRISAPLRRLTLAATQIRDELPKIVESVQSDEDFELHLPVVQTLGSNEVSLLAAAFVDVNAVTVEIAREQARLRAAVADMFVNVARRNQVLLSRQLSLIDQLERNEVNPDALEELFRLDHLATRMRRNAESLLVLAGIESGRRLREPMPLSDVVRTATSEIEHYSRVTLSLAVDPPVYAHLALPIAHLLAELLENATNFSDPGSSVVVMSTATSQGIRMTVADDGLGMSASELLEINARIDEPPTAEALSSQRLGLFVVGRLAQRLDAKVTLTSGRARGTAVLIDLPASLFVPGSVDGSSAPEYPGVDRSAAAPGLPSGQEQGGTPARAPEPVGAAAGGSPFVGAFPGAPAVPAAFDSAAFDAVNALEPVWTPQPDNLPIGEENARIVEQFAPPTLPARRSGSAVAEPLPAAQPLAMPVVEPAEPAPPAAGPQGGPISEMPTQTPPEWATSDWVSEPVEAASAPAAETAQPTPDSTEAAPAGASIFSGFRSRQAEAAAATAEPAQPSEPAVPVPEPAPVAFLDSAEAVDGWYDAGTPTPAAGPDTDEWQTWDEGAPAGPEAAPAPASTSAPSWNDVDAAEHASDLTPSASDDFAPIPAPADPTPVTWAPQPVSEPVAEAPEQEWEQHGEQSWAPAADVPQSWAPEPQAEVEQSWTPQLEQPRVAPPQVEQSQVEQPWAPEPEVEQSWAPAPETEQPWAPTPQLEQPWAPTPQLAQSQVEPWAPEPQVEQSWAPAPETEQPWAPETQAEQPWAPAPQAEQPWATAPQAEEPWAPQPDSSVPVEEPWSPAPNAEPAAQPEPWSPDVRGYQTDAGTYPPVPEPWNPTSSDEQSPAAAYPPVPEPWTPEPAAQEPEPEPEAWTPQQPEAWTPEPEQAEPERRPEVRSELSQTLTAAIDILPARTTIRTALGRGRRKNDAPATIGLPFNGGFDPIAPAREFARREGFGSSPEPEAESGGLPADLTGIPSPSGPVPEPSRPRDSQGQPVERRQHPRPDDGSGQGRSALASEALTELSRLSSYSPTSMPDSGKGGLQRRTPHDVPVDEQPPVEAAGQRARTAASVRSMLAGFKAGVERGRTSPSANRPATEANLPPQPRNSPAGEPR